MIVGKNKAKVKPFEPLIAIIKDIRDNAFIALLYGIICATAMMTIVITAKSKVEVTRNQELRAQVDDLNNEWLNLTLEYETLSEHSRVMRIAEDKLGMMRQGFDTAVTLKADE